MSADRSIDTAHGRLDRQALEQARQEFDTTGVLRIVDELGDLLRDIHDTDNDDGWRDRLLRLHQMAHTVIDGAVLADAKAETLPELASEVIAQMGAAIERLRRWRHRLAPLAALAAEVDGPHGDS